jgi:hypothetical protein
MYIDTSVMAKTRKLAHTAPGRSGTTAEVIIDGIYAPVSGSLMLGSYSGELEAIQHLKGIQAIEFRGTRTATYSTVELTKISNIYRLFGHNITIFDSLTNEAKVPWAAVNECVIEPCSIAFDCTKVRAYTLGWSDQREGRCVPLPALGSLGQEGSLKMVIQKPSIELIKFRTAQTPVTTYTTIKRDKLPVPIMIKSAYSYKPGVFKARKGIRYQQSDFRSEGRQAPPDIPEGPQVTEVVQTTVPMEALPESAETAGLSTHGQPLSEVIEASSIRGQAPIVLQSAIGRSLQPSVSPMIKGISVEAVPASIGSKEQTTSRQ